MGAAHEVKISVAVTGPNDDKEFRLLGRVLSYTPDGLFLEGDPRHHEAVLRLLGLTTAKGVEISGCAQPKDRLDEDIQDRRVRAEPMDHDDSNDSDVPLTGARREQYASLAARLNYLALDRPDIMYAVKELMRRMSQPTEGNWTGLKRAARFLLKVPRLVAEFPWGALDDTLIVYVDSDFAGCHVTRKSTAGGIITWGGRLLKGWSKTMASIALSSSEAELGAVARGVVEGLGLQSVLRDFGVHLIIRIRSDATAAIGMCRRLGLGRVRRLATADLWVQQRVRSGEVTLGKLPGTENPADALTKNVPGMTLEYLSGLVGLRRVGKRPRV